MSGYNSVPPSSTKTAGCLAKRKFLAVDAKVVVGLVSMDGIDNFSNGD